MAGAPQKNFDSEFNHDMTPHLETWGHFNQMAKWIMGLTIATLVGMYLFLVPHG
ncbi:MAG: hypothetical protein JNN22_12785 [Rhodospirillales bacterium]|nr:hypothetical protein [Rhodospirillales bacterium]